MKQATIDSFIRPYYGDELVDVIQKIDQVRELVLSQKKWTDPEWLSQAVVKLATLNSYLGEYVAQAFYDAATAEASYKTTREQKKLEVLKDKTKTASEAESQKYADTEEELEKMNQAAYNHKLLQIKRSDTSELIDTIRSRLSYMRVEREHTT